MVKKGGNVLGGWAFLIGVILAVILSFIGKIDSTWTWILVITGLIVGLLNVADKEVDAFLMSGTVLIIASALSGGVIHNVGILSNILDSLLLIFVPAVIVVAIKHVFSLAKN